MFLDMVYFLRLSVMRFVLSAFANMMVFDVNLMFTTDVSVLREMFFVPL